MVHDVACAQGRRAVPLAAARVNSMSEVIYYYQKTKQSEPEREEGAREGAGRLPRRAWREVNGTEVGHVTLIYSSTVTTTTRAPAPRDGGHGTWQHPLLFAESKETTEKQASCNKGSHSLPPAAGGTPALSPGRPPLAPGVTFKGHAAHLPTARPASLSPEARRCTNVNEEGLSLRDTGRHGEGGTVSHCTPGSKAPLLIHGPRPSCAKTLGPAYFSHQG